MQNVSSGPVGGELVCRLVAATPPYLYSGLGGAPHCYFFSDLLRGLARRRATITAATSAFATPASVPTADSTSSVAMGNNPLAASRLLPRLRSLYASIGEKATNKTTVIGLELVVTQDGPP